MTIQEMRAQYERQDYKEVSDYDLIAMYESAVSRATEMGDICIMLYNTRGYTDDSNEAICAALNVVKSERDMYYAIIDRLKAEIMSRQS